MFTDPEDVQISVSASALDVAVVRAVPLIEHFENVDLMPTEMKSPGMGIPRWPAYCCLNT